MLLTAVLLFVTRSLLGGTTWLPEGDSLLVQRAAAKEFRINATSTTNPTRFGKKFFRGSCLVFGFNTLSSALLIAMPENTTKWDKAAVANMRPQYKRTFTKAPVIDGDLWYVNYIGHPYEGACYYNALRSQGATWWQSGLFSIGHSLLWEYIAEGGMEQPSMQDMLVTPLVGSLLGELIHYSTLRMGRNGFTWYEKAFVCVLNPMYVLTNGLRKKAMPYTP